MATAMTAFPSIDLIRTGKRIEAVRKSRGFSVRDIQEYFGFEYPQAVYKWQHGECLPSADNLFALARLLRVNMEDLLVAFGSEDQGVFPFVYQRIKKQAEPRSHPGRRSACFCWFSLPRGQKALRSPRASMGASGMNMPIACVRNFFSVMFPYAHGNIWPQARETENQTERWHREQNLPVVVLRKADLFNRVVSALQDKPGDGDKGSNPGLPQGELDGKTITKSSPFCPRATAEGMVESESAVHRRVPNPETEEKRLWFPGVSCATANASEILRKPLKPKGRGRRREGSPQDEQGCEFWALSKR